MGQISGDTKVSTPMQQPGCCDSGEVLLKLALYAQHPGPIHPNAVAYAAMFATMPDRQLAHAMRKRSDEEIAAMLRSLAISCVEKHGTQEQKEGIRTRDLISQTHQV